MDCPNFSENKCAIASQLAGLPVVFDVRACDVCARQLEPRAKNKVTVDIAVHAMRQAGESKAAAKLYEDYHKRAIRLPENEEGAGTELKLLIAWFWSPKKKCGKCADRVSKMNKWGPAKCRKRRPLIIQWLKQSARKNGLPFSEFVAGEIIDLAIANAERKVRRQSLAKPIKPDPKWAVAVTTAPRKDCTLEQCIESMRVCGWDPIVFAEPGSTEIDARTIWNSEKLGVWHNWIKSAKWCIENTAAEYILTVQDDSLFHQDSKAFVEQVLWPREDAAFVSLYTPKHYTIIKNTAKLREPGVNRIYTRSLWGACALVWPRDVLKLVVNHKIAKAWAGAAPKRTVIESGKKRRRRKSEIDSIYQKRSENPSTIANSDTAIGKIVNSLDRSMWFIDPSPVQHIARFSTIGHGGNDGRRNAWRIADHGKSLADQVPIKQQVSIKV